MENSNSNNRHEITIVSLSLMDRLSFGDVFLFSTYGPKYVFFGRTSDGRYSYMPVDSKRKYYCRRKRQVFVMDANGGLFICNGRLFVDFDTAMACATLQ